MNKVVALITEIAAYMNKPFSLKTKPVTWTTEVVALIVNLLTLINKATTFNVQSSHIAD